MILMKKFQEIYSNLLYCCHIQFTHHWCPFGNTTKLILEKKQNFYWTYNWKWTNFM